MTKADVIRIECACAQDGYTEKCCHPCGFIVCDSIRISATNSTAVVFIGSDLSAVRIPVVITPFILWIGLF